jgi:hypothetical protein
MSASTQYVRLLEKVAHRASPTQVRVAHAYCMAKTAGVADKLMWGATGALPAYLVGEHLAKEKEQAKHKNYALAGAAAGFLAPKLLGALVDPSGALPSVSGFDAQDIINLQLQDIT